MSLNTIFYFYSITIKKPGDVHELTIYLMKIIIFFDFSVLYSLFILTIIYNPYITINTINLLFIR